MAGAAIPDCKFQSTHPARGATRRVSRVCVLCVISIHAPREGCDQAVQYLLYNSIAFQSTHPARGATGWPPCHVRCKTISIHAPREGCDLHRRYPRHVKEISIHAPREGCDHRSGWHRAGWHHFNPRTPRGVRHLVVTLLLPHMCHFNPRTPRGVRHGWEICSPGQFVISIHAPREGCDSCIRYGPLCR